MGSCARMVAVALSFGPAVALGVTLVGARASAAGDRELGRHLSSECVTCHQLSGRVVAGIPTIVGIDAESFVAMMNAYRSGERSNAVMQAIAGKLSDEETAALAAYFGGLGK
jgi:cytochrome c553